jgi:hypothetical protein
MTVVMKLHIAGQTPSVAVQGAHCVVVYGVVGVGVMTVWIVHGSALFAKTRSYAKQFHLDRFANQNADFGSAGLAYGGRVGLSRIA